MSRLVLLVAVALSGCASVDPMQIKKLHYGYKPYDPCIRCGEKFQQLPNWRNEAIIRRERGEEW